MPVAAIVGEAERLLVDHLDEALRPAAVLDIGRAVRGGGGEKRRVEPGDELGKLRRHLVGKAFRHALRIGLGRAAFGLRLARGRREHQGGIVHGARELLCASDRVQDRRARARRKVAEAIKPA